MMTFTLPALPYDYQVLEPYIDKETMFIHHTKHHQTYVDKLNLALKDYQQHHHHHAEGGGMDLTALQSDIAKFPVAVRNNGGGHYNHSLFWKFMTPVGSSNSSPTGELKVAINEAFGSFETMKQKFTDAAVSRFGSGWAWLGVQPDGQLAISSTANQDNPLMKGIAEVPMIPVLGLDVWEHAYYLKYQNKRADYIQHWWNVVNWDQVVEFYDLYASKAIPIPI